MNEAMSDETLSNEATPNNTFLVGSLPTVFLKTAAPIILIMMVNGSFSLVDAYFLGIFVGPQALTAVTSMFPAFMLIVALSTLVSNGFASIMARLLGAGDYHQANQAFAQAITLSLVMCMLLVAIFLLGGHALTSSVSNGSVELATMSYDYIAILVFFSPLAFILAINGDSLRCEGKIPVMALVSILSVVLNGLFNYLFIVELNWGVVGSAYGTVLAQAVSIAIIFVVHRYSSSVLNVQILSLSFSRAYWRKFLALGAPSSLTYLGLALSSGAILYNIQIWQHSNYATTVAAYGIITRLMTFIFLPLLGLSMAFQTIVGNNVGAKQWQRANSGIKIALTVSLLYCVTLQLIVLSFNDSLGKLFSNDLTTINEVSRILPFSTMALFLLGPLMMVTMLFQAIGDAKHASILGLAKTYCFSLPLIFILPFIFAEWGIWYAAPGAEFLALMLTLTILYKRKKTEGKAFGLFFKESAR